jgi:hypothetical protein
MKRILLALCLLGAFLNARAFAALGDDESKVENLFGKPAKEGVADNRGVTTNLYEKGDYAILVQFLNHLSLAESYARIDQHELSQKEIDAFLEGSSNGRLWIKDADKLAWERSDSKAKAWCTTVRDHPTLLIEAQ